MDRTLTIQSHRGPYKVFFEDGLGFLDDLKKRNAIWVIDQNVATAHPEVSTGLDANLVVLLEALESKKTSEEALALCAELARRGCRKNTDLIVIGGGITQDVVGFAASILFRGVRWIFVPTTLLAQADSCIGSKTSLNLDSHKNLLGTFYPPKEVHISAEFLKTLPAKEIFSGRGEIVKLLITKAKTTEDLVVLANRLDSDPLPNLIRDTLLIKKEYIEEDEFDAGRRRMLNYGHCFGHALETVSGFAIPHGLAVVAGMIVATEIARKRNWVDQEVRDFSTRRILWPALHAEVLGSWNHFLDRGAIWEAMKKDKKRTGDGVAMVLPQRVLELQLAQDISWEEFNCGVSFLEHFK